MESAAPDIVICHGSTVALLVSSSTWYNLSTEVLQLHQLLSSGKALSSSASYAPISLYCSMVLNSYFLDMQKMHVMVMVIFLLLLYIEFSDR